MQRIAFVLALTLLTACSFFRHEPDWDTVVAPDAASALLESATPSEAAAVAETAAPAEAPPSAEAAAEAATAAAPDTPAPIETAGNTVALGGQMEDMKRSLVELKRDLVVLEEELLYPASSQVAVFLSMDVGEFFGLDSVTLKLNGKSVTHYLYTKKQVEALFRGGVQRLFVGNVKQGDNELTAFFTGRGPEGRDYRRATTVKFEKSFEPSYVELKISDSTTKYQPEFFATVSP